MIDSVRTSERGTRIAAGFTILSRYYEGGYNLRRPSYGRLHRASALLAGK